MFSFRVEYNRGVGFLPRMLCVCVIALSCFFAIAVGWRRLWLVAWFWDHDNDDDVDKASRCCCCFLCLLLKGLVCSALVSALAMKRAALSFMNHDFALIVFR